MASTDRHWDWSDALEGCSTDGTGAGSETKTSMIGTGLPGGALNVTRGDGFSIRVLLSISGVALGGGDAGHLLGTALYTGGAIPVTGAALRSGGLLRDGDGGPSRPDISIDVALP